NSPIIALTFGTVTRYSLTHRPACFSVCRQLERIPLAFTLRRSASAASASVRLALTTCCSLTTWAWAYQASTPLLVSPLHVDHLHAPANQGLKDRQLLGLHLLHGVQVVTPGCIQGLAFRPHVLAEQVAIHIVPVSEMVDDEQGAGAVDLLRASRATTVS